MVSTFLVQDRLLPLTVQASVVVVLPDVVAAHGPQLAQVQLVLLLQVVVFVMVGGKIQSL